MKKFFLIISTLLLSCVFLLDNASQPSSVTIGESFTLTINGNYDIGSWSGGIAWLGMMLPNGFLVDSIVYSTSDTIAGVVTEVDSGLILSLNDTFPCDSHMCWQGYSVYAVPEESTGLYTAIVYAQVSDSTVPGSYLIDYRSGGNWSGVVVVDDSILDQPMVVTETGVCEIVEHRACNRNAIWPTIFKNTLNIFTDNTRLIEIFSNDGRLVKSFNLESSIQNQESAISWHGDDNAGRKLPSGVYFVKFVSDDYEETEKVLLIR